MARTGHSVTILTATGDVVPNAPIEIRLYSTGLLANIYEQDGTPITQTGATADANGIFRFWAEPGEYFARHNGVDVPVTVSLSPNLIDRLNHETLQDAIDDTRIELGDEIRIKVRVAGKGGGSLWDVVLSSGVITNEIDIVQCANIPSLALVLRESVGEVELSKYGVNDSSSAIYNRSAIERAIAKGHKFLNFPAGVINLDQLQLQSADTLRFSGKGREVTHLRSSITSGNIIYVDNGSGNTPNYRIDWKDLRVGCVTHQKDVTAFYYQGSLGGGAAGTGGAPFSYFRDIDVANVGVAFDMQRNWLLDFLNVYTFEVATAWRITNAANAVNISSSTAGGLSLQVVEDIYTEETTGDLLTGNLLDISSARGVSFNGGSIEGITNRAINLFKCDGLSITNNFIEVTPMDSNRIEACAGVSIDNNFYRIGNQSSGSLSITVPDSALVPIWSFVVSQPVDAGAFGASSLMSSVSMNQFQIGLKPASGTLTMFYSSGAGNPNKVKAEGNLLTMPEIGIPSPKHLVDYVMDGGLISSVPFTVAVKHKRFRSSAVNYRYSSISEEGKIVAGDSYPLHKIRIGQVFRFKDVSGSQPVTSTYSLKKDTVIGGVTTTTTLATATLPNDNDNTEISFDMTSDISLAEINFGDLIYVTSPGGFSSDRFRIYEGQFLIYPICDNGIEQ